MALSVERLEMTSGGRLAGSSGTATTVLSAAAWRGGPRDSGDPVLEGEGDRVVLDPDRIPVGQGHVFALGGRRVLVVRDETEVMTFYAFPDEE